jgi:protein-tyrosine-phosphatase
LDEILKVVPHLAEEYNKSVKEIMTKIEKADKIMLSAFDNSDVVINLNPNQLKDIVQKADEDKVLKVKAVVEAEFRNLPATIQTGLDDVLNTTNKDQRNKKMKEFIDKQIAAGVSRDIVQEYEKIARARTVTNSPAWAI